MSDRETVIVGSGQRWLDGKESSDTYFARARRATPPATTTLSGRLLRLLQRLIEGRS